MPCHGTCQAEFLDVARCNVEALNRALQEIPVEQVRVHVCWGNYAGPHHQERDGAWSPWRCDEDDAGR